jgi:hypothetical protein
MADMILAIQRLKMEEETYEVEVGLGAQGIILFGLSLEGLAILKLVFPDARGVIDLHSILQYMQTPHASVAVQTGPGAHLQTTLQLIHDLPTCQRDDRMVSSPLG